MQNLPAPLPFVATLRRPPAMQAMMSKAIRTLPIRYVHVYHTDTVLPKPELLRATIEFKESFISPLYFGIDEDHTSASSCQQLIIHT